MRTANLSVSLGVALMLVAGSARAQQVDTNPPIPNVLILLDNSGSMERMIDSSSPESSPASTCNCDATGATGCNFSAHPSPNRFALVQQAFTGTFTNGYNCAAMPRTPGSVFANEYKIAGVAPYDLNYYLPYHRPIAQDTSGTSPVACVYAPNALPGAAAGNGGQGVGPNGTGAGGNATDFPSNAVTNRTYGATPSTWQSCSFQQYSDGAIDTNRDQMRFGLMTFDQDPNPGIGVSAGTNAQVTNPAFVGMWSYFPGWNQTGGTCTYAGNPAGCNTPTLMAVGARNPAAPPWEGRMMPFPSTYDLSSQEKNNDNIQTVVMATRPYGATPLAGMFVGAQYYFWNDPTGPQKTDPYVQGNCRKQYIILVTDGAPNLDLRGQPEPGAPLSPADAGAGTSPYTNGCDSAGSPAGVCPFPLPETTAQTLYTSSGGLQKVKTYVIGFAVSTVQGTAVQCSSLVTSGNLASVCQQTPVPSNYAPCCELQKIAVYGGSKQAYFADSPGDLQNALNAILSDIGSNATTRTTPAYSPVIANVLASATPNESVFLASLNATPSKPWSGDVRRQQYKCPMSTSPSVPQQSAGDDFAADLNSAAPSSRTFIAFQADPVNGGSTVNSSGIIRPYVAPGVGDGVGKYSATMFAGPATTILSGITPAALNINSGSTPCYLYTPTTGGTPKPFSMPSMCRDLALDFAFAQQTDGSAPSDFAFQSRYGNAFGDVYHAQPAVVGPPGSLLQDAAYVGFAGTWSKRKQVVYVATNDGLLHAFWADVSQLQNNEMWALMPPAVMPHLLKGYPNYHQLLLDGSPIVEDVVWDRSLTNASDPTVFHTMLVAAYGPDAGGGYYAIDVTNPDPSALPSSSVPNDPPPPGPVFRWQLAGAPSGNFPLFGQYPATPAITTLYMDPGDGLGKREIGVAILPGGSNGSPSTTASCQRWGSTGTYADSAPLTGYAKRSSVRCWGSNQQYTDPVIGRSVSIVRLDTGEILRVFARQNEYTTTTYKGDTLYAKNRVNDTPLDSPMTGTPIVYPSDVGTDATKFFIGDADGTLWRFDVSNPDPSQWTGELYLDLYNATVDGSSTPWADGQPVQVSPVLSLDTAGEVVLNLGTGSTQLFDTNGMYLVYSITEKVQGSTSGSSSPKLRASVNWYLSSPPPGSTSTGYPLQPGERVSGPMTVFNGVFYFATYSATQQGQQVCTGGSGRIWGLDFVMPGANGSGTTADTTCSSSPSGCSAGGMWELQTGTGPALQFITPQGSTNYGNVPSGSVIPGVSVKATPACASLGPPGQDGYVYGSTQHQAVQNFTSGGYSVFSTVGAPGTGGGVSTVNISVPPPISPTAIDSWAAVIE
jgi:type IV pilus assembly protein PilY1